MKQETLEVERWKWINGFNGYYKISSHGRVLSVSRNIKGAKGGCYISKERIIRPSKVGKFRNYYAVSLSKNGKNTAHRVSRLVAIHYVPNPLNKPEVNHDDGNTLNNYYKNLKWATGKENVVHAWENGLAKKLTPQQYKNLSKSAKTKLSIPVINIATGKRFDSIKQASEETTSSLSVISRHINGTIKKRLKWKRA